MLGLLLLAGLPAPRAGEGGTAAEEVVVEEERPEERAGSLELDREEVEAFPARSADELLEALPGLHESAHGGRGKAYQYFLRGFDAVHGSDLAVYLEGIPLNEVSNVHGQGYLDLWFLPTLLVSGMELYPGCYRPEDGDFDVAAAVELHLGLAEEGLLLEGGLGTDRSGLARLAWRPGGSAPGSFAVLEGDAGEGVGEQRAWRLGRAALGAEGWLGELHLRAFGFAYDGHFESPGVVREDDYEAGRLGFYDAYPVPGGGRSRQLLGGVVAEGARAGSGGRLLLYARHRELGLWHDFTGWYQDPEHGDAVFQGQEGEQLGARLAGWAGSGRLRLRGGLDLRADLFHQWERAITMGMEPWLARLDADARQGELGLWTGLDARPWDWLALSPGLRAELLGVELLRWVGDDGLPVREPCWARSWAPVLAPRGSLVLWPGGALSPYAAAGRGFRSPEARGIEDGDRAPVPVADTQELGARWRPPWGRVQLALFHTEVSDELVFDHAAGRFLSSGRTRRLGFELSARRALGRELELEGQLSWADGRYVATSEPLPYAPRWLGVLALLQRARERGPWRFSGELRGWFLGPRPLPLGFCSHPSLVVDGTGRLERGDWLLELELENALGSRWRDGEFVYPSDFWPEEPRSSLPALHFTAGDPFSLRVALGRRFR